jgi:hypothetical protein
LYLRLAFQISWKSQEPAILVCIDQKPRGSVSGPGVKYWYANVKMTISIPGSGILKIDHVDLGF